MITYPPILPIPQLDAWEATLTQITANPLEGCADFPAIAARHEAFWNAAPTDRPVILGSANKNPDRPITRRLELLHDPDAWFEAKQRDFEQTHRIGDTLPNMRVDFGPVLMGALFGAEIEFGADTSWTHAFIADDWSNAPDWSIQPDNPYRRLLLDLAARTADHAAGRYIVMLPDLGASGDVLLNLRGSSQLCMDVIDQPDRILAHVEAIYPAWHATYTALLDTIIGRGAGITFYLGLWSNKPHHLTACDFSAMISPRTFRELLLPDIARQAATAGRAIHHLDGPDATRHIDALLDCDELQAIQYVPGAGHSALDKLDMLKRIQDRGKALQIICPFEETLPLCDALHPEGLALLLDEVPGPRALDSLFAQVCARYGL